MKNVLKKVLSVLLAFAIIFNPAYSVFGEIDFSKFDIKRLFEVQANAVSEEDLYFYLNPDGQSYSITDSSTSLSGALVIPETYNGLPVTSIGDRAFQYCTGLTSITIPGSVTSIGDTAFHSCTGLTAVHITDLAAWCSISFGDRYANPLQYATGLYLNNELITDLIVPSDVNHIGTYSFSCYTALVSVIIPSSVISVGFGAFHGCTGLTSVTIPNSVTSIGACAFYNCTSLTSITIPDSVTSIGGSAFYGCTGLTAVHITDLAAWCSISFEGDSASNPLNCAKKLYLNNTLVTDLIVPSDVTSIAPYAFYNCTSLTSVTIPDSVTSIGGFAFSGCSGLTAVYITDLAAWCSISFGDRYANPLYRVKKLYLNNTLVSDLIVPSSVTSIAPYAFYNCTSLTSVTIPNSITSIGDSAFYGCTGLTSFTIPNSVTNIGGSAFEGCTGLTSVTIPNSVTKIGGFAFYGCTGLASIEIPDSVLYIGASIAINTAYYKDTANWENNLLYIGNHLVGRNSSITGDCILRNNTKTIASRVFRFSSSSSSITSITIPDGVVSIGDDAFYNCAGLTSVNIPDSVISIGDSTFYGCAGLASITIPDNITYIEPYTFYNCTNLTSIIIPDGVTSIGDFAFYNCTSLKDIYYSGTEFDWENVKIGSNNTPLTKATLHCHEHISSNEWVIETEPTCVEDGLKCKKCTDCGDVLETATIPATGHTSSDWIIDANSTCTTEGSKHKECTVCGTILATDTTDATGHTSSDWIIDTNSTCTAEGAKHKECTVCDTVLEIAVIPMLSHIPSDWYIGSDSTCTAEGAKHIKCSVCHNILETQPIPKIPHDLDGDFMCTICGQHIEGVARSYTIYVCDIETGNPIEGANVTLGSKNAVTDAKGAAEFQILSNSATTLKIVADTYPETDEAYTPTNQRNDYIYLESEESDIYGAWCNGDNIINGDSQINARAYALIADIVINARAKANIKKYELIQDSTVIATTENGRFEVRNTSFKVGKAVIVRVYTDGREGHNVFERKLNIKVVGFVFNMDSGLENFLPFVKGFTVSLPADAGCFGGLKLSFPNPFAKSSKITYHHQNDKIIVTMGFEHDFDDNGNDEPKDIMKSLLNDWVKEKKDKRTREAHGSFAIIIEFDENGKKDVYGQINVGFDLEFPAGKTFMVTVIPVRVDIVTSVSGELEVTKIKYDENLARLYSEYDFTLNGSISLYGGVGCRLLSAGVYGQAGIEVVLSSDQQSNFEKLRLYGEVGLYVKYKRLFGKAKYETLPLWHDQKVWPSHAKIAARLYSRDGYVIDPRDYLVNRTDWLNASLMSSNSSLVLLQDSTYTAIEPQIITCGDTIMMLFFDDDGSDGINYQHLYYSIYDKASGGWGEPQKLDDNNRCDIELDVYADESTIYVSYIEVDTVDEEDQDDDEKILGTAEVIVAQYDFKTGHFTGHTNISNNDSSDSLPTISGTADGIVVSWVNNFTNDVFSQNANNVIYYSSLEGQEWSEAEALTDRGATIVSMDVGSVDGKSYVAIIRDVDCDLTTTEDRLLYLIDLDGNITEIFNEINANDGAQFVEMNGEKKLIWYNNQNLYYINSITDTPSPMFTSAIDGLSANYKFMQVGLDSYAITFVQNEMQEDGEGNRLNSSSIYGVFYNNGAWGGTVPIVLNEAGYYVDAYDACMCDGKILIPYVNADVTITESVVDKTSTFLSTTFEPRNDIFVGNAEYLPSELFEGEVIELQVPVTNNAWQSIDEVSYEIKDAQGNVIHSGIWEQVIESGATEYFTTLLDKNNLTKGEIYSIHINSTDLIDVDLSNNVSKLYLWYTDFSIEASKVVLERNQEVQYTVMNEGNIGGNATLRIYKLAEDGSEIVLVEKDVSDLGVGEAINGSVTITRDYYDEGSDIGTVYLSVIPEKKELYGFNDSVSLTIGDIEYNETTGGDSSTIIIENPVISEPYIEYDKVDGCNISVNVIENGCSFVCVKELVKQNYSYSDGALTINKDYLATLTEGYHYFTLSYTSSGIKTEIVFIVEITDTSYESITITAENQEVIYDGNALELGKDILYSTQSQGEVTSEYSTDNGATWISGLPTEIGEYLVRLTVAQDDENRYLSANHTFTVTIKKEVRAISVPMIIGTDDSRVCFGASVPTAGKLDGTILYGYSLTNDVSTVTEWSEKGVLPRAQTYTTYYVFAKIVNGEKYEDAYSIGYPVEAHIHEYESVIVAPTVDSDGYTLHTCIGCNDQYKDNYVDKIGLVYGDCNGDGAVTNEDLGMLRGYFANKDPLTGESTINLQAGADCNGDNNITMVDLAMLRKYLENLNPVTGKSTVVLGSK